jgi:hypothetical protein
MGAIGITILHGELEIAGEELEDAILAYEDTPPTHPIRLYRAKRRYYRALADLERLHGKLRRLGAQPAR